MSELILWPQVLFVLLPDPHNKNVFLTKSYSLFMCENQMALLSITLIPQLCSRRKPMAQHTKSGGTNACLPLIIPYFYISLHGPLLSPSDWALRHLAQLCLISLTWFLHHSWSGATCLGSALGRVTSSFPSLPSKTPRERGAEHTCCLSHKLIIVPPMLHSLGCSLPLTPYRAKPCPSTKVR